MNGETGKLAPRTSTMAQRLTASKKPSENFIELRMTAHPLLSLTIRLLPELMGQILVIQDLSKVLKSWDSLCCIFSDLEQ